MRVLQLNHSLTVRSKPTCLSLTVEGRHNYTTKQNKNMRMTRIEYEITQLAIAHKLHKQKSEILKNTRSNS